MSSSELQAIIEETRMSMGSFMSSNELKPIQSACLGCGKSINIWHPREEMFLCVDCLRLQHQEQQTKQKKQLATMKQIEDGKKLADDMNGTPLFVGDEVLVHTGDGRHDEKQFCLSRYYRDKQNGKRELTDVSPAGVYVSGVTILQPDELILIRRRRRGVKWNTLLEAGQVCL